MCRRWWSQTNESWEKTLQQRTSDIIRSQTTASEDGLESSAEISVEYGIEERVDTGVGVSEPEEERF